MGDGEVSSLFTSGREVFKQRPRGSEALVAAAMRGRPGGRGTECVTPRGAGIAGDLRHPRVMGEPCVVSPLPALRPRPCPRSIVHLCLRKADQKLVILKQIPVEQMSKDERLAAQNECQVLKLLSHPNVIEYYENFLEDKALMIAMEYAPGGPCCPPVPVAAPLAGPGDAEHLALFGSSCCGLMLCSL